MAEENLNETMEEGGNKEEEKKLSVSGVLIRILMIVAAVLVGIILMVIIANIVFNIKSTGVSKQEEMLWAPGVTPKKQPYQTLHIDSLKLNLNDPTGTNPVFIQIELALAYEQNNIKLQTELLARKFEIRDKIITLISSKTYEDINTPDKIQNLKKEIKNQVNTLLISGLIEDVYIIDFNAVPRT